MAENSSGGRQISRAVAERRYVRTWAGLAFRLGLGERSFGIGDWYFGCGEDTILVALFASCSGVLLFLRFSPAAGPIPSSFFSRYPLSIFFTSLSSSPFRTPCSRGVLFLLGGMYERVRSACQKMWLLQCMYDADMVGELSSTPQSARVMHHRCLGCRSCYIAAQIAQGW